MGIFNPRSRIIISAKGSMGSRFAKNPAMREMMKNKRIAKIFAGKPKKQREFFQEIKKYSTSGSKSITRDEMREVLGKFKFENDSLSSVNTQVIAQELIGSRKRYIAPEKKKNEAANVTDKISQQEEKGAETKKIESQNPEVKSNNSFSSGKSRVSESNVSEESLENKDKPNIYEALRNVKHGED